MLLHICICSVHECVCTNNETLKQSSCVGLASHKICALRHSPRGYQSAKPTIFPSHTHQISSSSSSFVVRSSPTPITPCSTGGGRSASVSPNADPPLHPIQAPSVRTLFDLGLLFPSAAQGTTAPAFSRKPSSTPSNVRVRFCRAAHAGCKNRRGARKNRCVWVGAGASAKGRK